MKEKLGKYVVQLETCEQVTKFEIKINDIQEYVLTNKCRYSEIDELYQSKFTKWLKKPGFSIPVGLSFLFSIINLIISINTCNKETTIEKITDKKKEIPFTNHEIDSIIDTRFNVLTKITN